MYGVCTVTFVDKIPTVSIVMVKILAVVYYFNTIVIASDPECVTNNTGDNKNKYPAPDYVVSINSHSFKKVIDDFIILFFAFQHAKFLLFDVYLIDYI